MSAVLSSAEVVDLIRSSGLTQPTTTIKVLAPGATAIVTDGKFKNIGPSHIDFGDTNRTTRVSLDQAFIRVNCETQGNFIELVYASTAP
jgi:hypothetical protein